MQDLRLLPSALTSWAVVLLVILTGGPGWAVVLLVVVGAVCIFTGHWQHAMLVVAAAGAALFMAATRQRRAAAFSYPCLLYTSPSPRDRG